MFVRWLRAAALRVLSLALLGSATAISEAPAQGRPQLEVVLPAAATLAADGPVIRALNVVSDKATRELLGNGFPIQLHYRVELWSAGGLFNSLKRQVEWDVIVRYDAMGSRYRIARIIGDRVEPIGQYAQFADAVADVERGFKAPITARTVGDRQYYAASLDVEILSLNDLDEVERWLRGELKPAVRGDENPGTAVGRGMRKLFVRLLGGERRNLEARSGTFRVAREAP